MWSYLDLISTITMESSANLLVSDADILGNEDNKKGYVH